MSLTNLSPISINSQLSLVELKKKIPLIIPNEVLDKIKYLCKTIPRDEWSGPIFYTVEGSITDIDNFKITLKDLLPLDKGTPGYTSYSIDNRFIDFMEEDPMERMEWQMGHCHSHNTMKVFFSGTDIGELTDNAKNYNYYLSLIVNNYMDMTARVAFVGKMEHNLDDLPYIALSDDGLPYTIQTASFTTKKEKLFYYECDIISERELINVPENFRDKVTEILKPKVIPLVPLYLKTPYVVQSTPSAGYQKPRDANYYANLSAIKPLDYKIRLKDNLTAIDWAIIEDDNEEEEEEDFDWAQIETFAAQWLNFSAIVDEELTLADVLLATSLGDPSAMDYAQKAISTYTDLYFRDYPNTTESEFIESTYALVDILEGHEDEFPFLRLLTKALTHTAEKLENFKQ